MRAMTPQLATLIERLKRENPHRTGATLLRDLALSSEHHDHHDHDHERGLLGRLRSLVSGHSHDHVAAIDSAYAASEPGSSSHFT